MKRVTFKFKREFEIAALVPDDFEEAEAKEVAQTMIRSDFKDYNVADYQVSFSAQFVRVTAEDRATSWHRVHGVDYESIVKNDSPLQTNLVLDDWGTGLVNACGARWWRLEGNNGVACD